MAGFGMANVQSSGQLSLGRTGKSCGQPAMSSMSNEENEDSPQPMLRQGGDPTGRDLALIWNSPVGQHGQDCSKDICR